MLSVEAALSGTLGVSVNTILLLYGVASYDDDFVDTNSVLWCCYACLALLTYLMAIAMAIVKVDELAYIVLASSGLSSACLCVWLMGKRKPKPEPAPDTIELLDVADREDRPQTPT